METKPVTPKAIEALRLLRGTDPHNTRSAKALAKSLWPDRMEQCDSSLRRGGLYRAAGAYFSKLQKRGLCDHWMDDFSRGYYITPSGLTAIDSD